MELRELLTQVFTGSLSAQIELISTFQDFGYNIKLIKIEEEKKMLNFDKYREEVEKRAAWAVREGSENPKPAHLVLNEIIIGKGLPYMKGNELVDWLFEEYEPPLLENGDGLKPGDWVMVRNYTYDDWKKVRFMCYFDGYFFTTETFVRAINYKTCSVFTQARLPEEDE